LGDAACALDGLVGRRVRVTGIMAAARRVPTKQGGRMLFLTLDDGTGLAECTLFPDAYARAGPGLTGGGVYVATGRVESQHGAITINVETVEALAHPNALPLEIANSRWL
jgi:DNA polymerase III alpha subunit